MFDYQMRVGERVVDGIERSGRSNRGRATRAIGAALVMMLGIAAACAAPAIKRDLSRVPPGQVGFDDLCGLQGYFDALAVKKETAPKIVDAADIQGLTDFGGVRGGRARFAFETESQLATLRRILNENWRKLPPALATAHAIDVDVHWSERGGLRRVVTNDDAELIVDGQRSSLPYHICLSELLFGEPLYQQRREILGLAPLPTAHSLALQPEADGGARDASRPESAATATATAPSPAPAGAGAASATAPGDGSAGNR